MFFFFWTNSLAISNWIEFSKQNEISFYKARQKKPRGKDYILFLANKKLWHFETGKRNTIHSWCDKIYKIRNFWYLPCRRTSRRRYARARKQSRDVHQKIRKRVSVILLIRKGLWNEVLSFLFIWLPLQIWIDNRQIEKPHTRSPAVENKKRMLHDKSKSSAIHTRATARRAGSAADWKDAVAFGPPWSAHGPLWPLVVRPTPHHTTTQRQSSCARTYIFFDPPPFSLPSCPHSSMLRLDSPRT